MTDDVSVGSVSLRIIARDQKTLQRAVTQISAQTGAQFGALPSHPGRKGDWLIYGAVDVYIPPEEPTRRRPARTSPRRNDPGRYVTDNDLVEMRGEALARRQARGAASR